MSKEFITRKGVHLYNKIWKYKYKKSNLLQGDGILVCNLLTLFIIPTLLWEGMDK